MVGMGGGADLCELLRPHLISRHRHRHVHRVQMQRRLRDERLQVTKLRGGQIGSRCPPGRTWRCRWPGGRAIGAAVEGASTGRASRTRMRAARSSTATTRRSSAVAIRMSPAVGRGRMAPCGSRVADLPLGRPRALERERREDVRRDERLEHHNLRGMRRDTRE